MRDLSGKTAFITGGAGGLGLGMGRAFAAAGMKLVLADIDEKALAASVADLEKDGIDALGVALDVTDRNGWARAADQAERRFGPVHVLCNNAGITALGWNVDQIPVDLWDLVININLNGVFNGTHTLLPRIKAHGQGGHVVNTASLSALRGRAGHAVYCTAKHALVGFSESLKLELIDDNIGVSVFCPATVRSNLMESSRKIRATVETRDGPGSQATGHGTPLALDALDVGRRVRKAIEDNAFFIVTHPEHRALVEARHQLLLSAFDVAEQPL